jgi:hypothetical protein
MAQVACPKCGGYKLTATEEITTPVSIPKGRRIMWSVVVLVIFGILIFGILIYFPKELLACVAVPLFFGGVSLVAAITFTPNKKIGQVWTCDLCGFEVRHISGTPWPSADLADPSLLAKGAARLAAEEERIRTASIPCPGCGNTIPSGYPYCPHCGGARGVRKP